MNGHYNLKGNDMNHEFVEITQGFKGFLVTSKKPNASALVLIHEIFGITQYIRDLAAQYASMGYTVLVPDLFWRVAPCIELDPAVPEQRERAMQLNLAYDDALGMHDLTAAVSLLRSKIAPGRKVGAVGYCLGGRLAFRMATQNSVDAAVSYYGVNIHKLIDDAQSSAPLLIHVAGADYLCPPEAQQAIAKALGSLPQVTVRNYEGAGHAFARPNSQHFAGEAAKSADSYTAEFLRHWLDNGPAA